MTGSTLFRLRGAVAATALLAAAAWGQAAYAPKIPAGYTSTVVLHVDYGTTPDKIRVNWGGGNGEEDYSDPTSLSAMRVVGDRFYFIDSVAGTVKEYRSPGTLVWESERLPNLEFFDVAPDGTVYTISGIALRQLSCIGSAGKVLWTKDYGTLLPRATLPQLEQELGLTEINGSFSWVDWTSQGLAVTTWGYDASGNTADSIILLDGNGKLLGVLSGSTVGADGTAYSPNGQGLSHVNDTGGVTVLAKSPGTAAPRAIRLDFSADRGDHLAGNPRVTWIRAAPGGGFVVCGWAHLPARVASNSHLTTNLEHVLWRFDSAGNITEEWRFLSEFFSLYCETVVGLDGNVYHVEFSDAGIDVTKYTRSAGAPQ